MTCRPAAKHKAQWVYLDKQFIDKIQIPKVPLVWHLRQSYRYTACMDHGTQVLVYAGLAYPTSHHESHP
ncbi:hypothetical protein ACO0LF_18420 [Undibacterium sp. Di27W]|uniref:hypothetical protein n=1 Tax=Undibacterium sp. Di27W TaxID=3413036 RepID=UPI003BF00D19